MGIEGKVLKHPVTGCADGPASNTEASPLASLRRVSVINGDTAL